MAKRTELRSKAGKKLYAVRENDGQFKDIQTYQRAHSQDIKRSSAGERAAKAKVAAKAAAPAAPAKPVAAPKATAKPVAAPKATAKPAAVKPVAAKP
ncbi:MAG: hypothetical protein ACK48X_11515, partial [Planctomycetota bacterium]